MHHGTPGVAAALAAQRGCQRLPHAIVFMQVGLWRDGMALELPVRVSTPKQLVPLHSHDLRPSYFIYAGLVFTRLSNFYLRSMYGADWGSKAPIKLCERSFAGTMEADGQQVVLLSKVGSAWNRAALHKWPLVYLRMQVSVPTCVCALECMDGRRAMSVANRCSKGFCRPVCIACIQFHNMAARCLGMHLQVLANDVNSGFQDTGNIQVFKVGARPSRATVAAMII